ncbi:MAG: class I SAM-dependent methyltransferase [Proteobacteria bacterium]|nr:class I SAM-dependent methyltransferase [Pseudomonadota bacterium]
MTRVDNIYDNQKIVPKARGSIHQVITSWLSTQPGGKLLDAPAGYGHLSMKLKELGYEVICGEIEPEIFKVKGIECIFTDLNRNIQAPDESFDYVCCVDGLEHMTDPYRAVEEFSRVLKPGGVGIFSIPNYSNIEKRFRYFIKGSLTKPKTVEDYKKAGSNLFNFHNSPLTITILDLIFGINDLKIEAILRDKVKKKQYLFFPLVFVMRMAAFLSSDRSRRKNRYDITLRDEVILGGNTLIFIVRKSRKS